MKVWGYVALVAAIVAAGGFALRSSYNSGYTKRDQEVQQDIIAAQADARKVEEEKWRQTVAEAEAQIVVEERIVEKIRVVEKEIPRVVREIVFRTPECADLGVSYAGLRNDQIRASNGIQSPPTPTPLDEGVPGT